MAILDQVFGKSFQSATTSAVTITSALGNITWQAQGINLQDYAMALGNSAIRLSSKPHQTGPAIKLDRKALAEVAEASITDERKRLANEAKQLLGYGVINEDIAHKEATKRVAEVFSKLGIEPLDRNKVNAYKQQKVDEVSNSYTRGQWCAYALAQYSRAVPEFAISRAIELKRELPDAQFFVEEIVTSRIDPFMYMVCGGETYYLDVWDEPGFEGRRTI